MSSVTPFLMFQGQAEEAIAFYLSLFACAAMDDVTRYGPGEPRPEGALKLATLTLDGQKLICFDSPVAHAFGFTPAISIMVDCDRTEEVDRLYAALSDGGQILMPLGAYPFARHFGWVNDRFGVSWQLRFS
jgi:predicted 3-demethylubiquinone-9 3-methyltransferase (glyoxalase superfamily)